MTEKIRRIVTRAPRTGQKITRIYGRVTSNGEPICCFCDRPVGRGRRTWCSQECVDRFSLLTDWGYIRFKVFERDKGICAACGLDTEKKREVHRIATHTLWRWANEHNIYEWINVKRSLERQWCIRRGDIWDADHIIPVSEGGGNELENLRTLCIRCHKLDTAQVAARAAERRRKEKLDRTGQRRLIIQQPLDTQ